MASLKNSETYLAIGIVVFGIAVIKKGFPINTCKNPISTHRDRQKILLFHFKLKRNLLQNFVGSLFFYQGESIFSIEPKGITPGCSLDSEIY